MVGFDRLTPKEREVLVHLIQGKKNKEIAHDLVIEEPTVETHLRHIFQKLGVRNRTQAVIYALHQGVIEIMENPDDTSLQSV